MLNYERDLKNWNYLGKIRNQNKLVIQHFLCCEGFILIHTINVVYDTFENNVYSFDLKTNTLEYLNKKCKFKKIKNFINTDDNYINYPEITSGYKSYLRNKKIKFLLCQ